MPWSQVGVKPRLGVKQYTPPVGVASAHKDGVYVTPNGVMFMPSHTRRGVLPRMLQEILDTRCVARVCMGGLYRRAHDAVAVWWLVLVHVLMPVV